LINFRSCSAFGGTGSSYLKNAYEKKILAPDFPRPFSKRMYLPSKKDIALRQQQYTG
jgi:hypothetical protein